MDINAYRSEVAMLTKRIQDGLCWYHFYDQGIRRDASDADHVFGRSKMIPAVKEHWLCLLGIHHDLHYDKHHQAQKFSLRIEIEALIDRNIEIGYQIKNGIVHPAFNLLCPEVVIISNQLFEKSALFIAQKANEHKIKIPQKYWELMGLIKGILYADQHFSERDEQDGRTIVPHRF